MLLLLTMTFDLLLSIILSFIKNLCQAKNTPSPKVLSFDTLKQIKEDSFLKQFITPQY